MSRTQFYEYKRRFQTHGLEGSKDLPPIHKTYPITTPPEEVERLLIVVKRLCYRTPVYKTKQNKLLFYADFLHFKGYSRSITGLCYVHLPLGPVPDQFERIFAALVDIEPAIVRDEDPTLDCPSDTFRCDAEPEPGVLTYDEQQIVFRVVEEFKTYGAKQIKDYSHQEEGNRRTQQGEVISYEFAYQLKM